MVLFMKQVFTKNNAITNALRVYNFAVSQIWSDKVYWVRRRFMVYFMRVMLFLVYCHF